METSGPSICEDGAVISNPNHKTKPIITSKIDKEALAAFIKFIESNFPNEEIISTIFSTREQLMDACGHSTPEDAERSAMRQASAYIVPVSEQQRSFILEQSEKWDLRAFGEVINIIGNDTNKGKALEQLSGHASSFWGEQIKGIIPIIFGNNSNDLPSFKKAIELGGMGILVGKAGGGFSIDPKDAPEGTTVIDAPHGHGILESVQTIKEFLQKRFEIVLP